MMHHDAMPQPAIYPDAPPDMPSDNDDRTKLSFTAPVWLEEEIERQVEAGAARTKSQWIREACWAKIGLDYCEP